MIMNDDYLWDWAMLLVFIAVLSMLYDLIKWRK